jgi:hypothetical protein
MVVLYPVMSYSDAERRNFQFLNVLWLWFMHCQALVEGIFTIKGHLKLPDGFT